MDRFIDETDAARDRSSSPNFHSLLASYGAENKRGELKVLLLIASFKKNSISYQN